uniref:Uncharacterized protein n=1 Tax=Acrobeloides nanus TaxID=290746 RepID=A0A914DRA8_9BILA
MGNKDSREQVIDDIGAHNNVLDNKRNVGRKSHDKVLCYRIKKKLKHEDPYLKLEKYKHPYENGQFFIIK